LKERTIMVIAGREEHGRDNKKGRTDVVSA